MAVTAFDQWSTARPLIQGYPGWVGDPDRTRIAAYSMYENLYWNVPESFKLILRGSDSKPIYIPSAKGIVETMNRHLAPGFAVIADPAVGSTSEQAEANLIWQAFARRERFYSRFAAAKRFGLIRGDWCFHVMADSERPEGVRISLLEIDPGSYFKIVDPDDVDVVIGAHIVEQQMFGDDVFIYRQTYRKVTEMGGPSPISVEEALFETDAWGGPDMDEKRVRVIRAPEVLPAPIDQIPIYHMRNFTEGAAEWGSSELRGIERLIAAINQGISDEELELVMNGLGVYITDAGTPIDPLTGENKPWNLGPAKVIELPAGKTFERVTGTSTVAPYQEHLAYLHDQLDQGIGNPAIAKGIVDVEIAESGIALALQMAPIFARAEEKELDITDVTNNLLFDLRKWFQAYESITIGEEDRGALWVPHYGERTPTNKAKRFEEIMAMFAAKIVSAQWVRKELTKIGYEFDDDTTMMAQILEEVEMFAQIEADVGGARMDEEIDKEEA